MERYGTKPKRFTHDWWEYVWMYYKLHIGVVALVLFFALTTLYQYMTRTEYDLTVSYMDKIPFSEELQGELSELIMPAIDELTGNEQKDIFYMQYIYNPSDNGKTEVMPMENYAMQIKFVAELQAGESDIYLMHREDIEAIADYAECFVDVSEYVSGEYTDEDVMKDVTGRAYAYSLKKCPAFSSAEYEDMYILVRVLSDMNSEKGNYAVNHENSIKAAKVLAGSK